MTYDPNPRRPGQQQPPFVPIVIPAPGTPPSPPPTYPTPPASAPRPGRKRMSPGVIVLIVVAAFVVLCGGAAIVGAVVAGQPKPTGNAAQPGSGASTTTTTGPAAAPAAPAVTTAAAPPKVDPDQVYTGRGDKVVKLAIPDGLHYATISHTGSGNFAIWTIGSGGNKLDLIVNEIGNYAGVRPIDFTEKPAALEITANGTWKVTVSDLAKAPVWTGKSTGKGSAVLLVNPADGGSKGLTTVKFTHAGRSNIAVIAWGHNSRDLLVNEIGAYTGEVLLPDGTVVIEIEADGAWTVQRTG